MKINEMKMKGGKRNMKAKRTEFNNKWIDNENK